MWPLRSNNAGLGQKAASIHGTFPSRFFVSARQACEPRGHRKFSQIQAVAATSG
jgi:hypothetical protein